MPGEGAESLGRVRAGGAVAVLLDALPATPVVSAEDVERLTHGGRLYAMLPRLVEARVLAPLTDRKRDQLWGAIDVLDELDDLNRRIGRRALAEP
ncbi:hypothetical protein ACIB24_08175 [Spongisporangium articulatum]|uniref:Uncharacterized protein n=1 Tax=Spongisporangium articulatum TaxID=3362603 RepID=A0ABW8AL37_9ACTN